MEFQNTELTEDTINVSLNNIEYIDKKYDELKYNDIREKILEDIKGVIKMEIQKYIESKCNKDALIDEQNITKRTNSRKTVTTIVDNELITGLKCEINFLREEIREKNELIKILATNSMNHNNRIFTHDGNNLINSEKSVEKNNNYDNESIESLNPLSPVMPNFEITTPDTSSQKMESVNLQLTNYRNQQHENFVKVREDKKESSDKTIFVVGDSILNGIEEKMTNGNKNVKIRFHSGAKIQDMYEHINDVVEKKPDCIILHVGTNDAKEKPSNQIVDEVLAFKNHVEKLVSKKCEIIISSLTPRIDDGKAGYTVRRFNEHLNQLKVHVLDNSNILVKDLGRKGLHLSKFGKLKLARNITNKVEELNRD